MINLLMLQNYPLQKVCTIPEWLGFLMAKYLNAGSTVEKRNHYF